MSTSALSGATLMGLLSALPLPSTAAVELITLHAPLSQPSSLPSSQLSKWLTRLNAAVSARDPAAAEIAAVVIRQDDEGHAAATCGKSWMGACLGVLNAPATPIETLPPFLDLARALVAAAPHAPTFEREVVHPAIGKLAVAMGRLVERVETDNVLMDVLGTTRALIAASPAPFRPAVPALRGPLTAIVLRVPGHEVPEAIRIAAAETLAVLYLTGGKAAAPAAWGAEMRDTLGGISASLSALSADAWEEEPPRAAPLPPASSIPAFPMDPNERIPAALSAMEGYTEVALALLRMSTARPVPVPIAQLVSCALRCLNLSLDTHVADHISPQHHAALVAALPRIWTSGLLLLAATIAACGDHLVPHLSAILEHTVYLLERVPIAMTDARLKLLHFHSIFMEAYPPATLPVEYTTRLLRFSLGVLGTLLDSRPAPTSAPAGRKSKKRARGQEDALVSGLEGRAPRAISKPDADILIAAVSLPLPLHTAVPQPLLALSLRLHISLHQILPTRQSAFVDRSSLRDLQEGVARVLDASTTLEVGGTARDVRALLISLLPSTVERNTQFNLLLHPVLPPLSRPLPPLSQLQLLAPESDEEKRLRKEMGFGDNEDEDEEMVVDEWVTEPVKQVQVVQVPVQQPAQLAPAPVTTPAIQPFSAPIAVPVAAPIAAPTVAVDVAATAAEPAVPVNTMPFMSAPTQTQPVTQSAPVEAVVPAPADESEDEGIPDLDSGSSDEEDDDDDE